MILVGTNVLARFCCDNPGDPEAARRRPLARRTIIESPAVFVPLTAVSKLEWVMRGFHAIESKPFFDARFGIQIGA